MNFLKEEISLSIKEESLTDTGVTLILENNSDIEVQYGNPYEIEVKKDGNWEDMDVKIDFTLQAFILEPKKYATILLNWEDSYGELEEGEYRILKDISYDKGNENYETFYVSVEFTIQ